VAVQKDKHQLHCLVRVQPHTGQTPLLQKGFCCESLSWQWLAQGCRWDQQECWALHHRCTKKHLQLEGISTKIPSADLYSKPHKYLTEELKFGLSPFSSELEISQLCCENRDAPGKSTATLETALLGRARPLGSVGFPLKESCSTYSLQEEGKV